MTEPQDIVTALSAKQKTFERWFVVSVMAEPEIAYNEYSWLPEKILLDKKSSDFWKKFLENGGDADKAALDSGSLQEISEAINEVHNLKRMDVYVDGIIKCSRLIKMARGATDLIKTCSREDMTMAVSVLSGLSREIESITDSVDQKKNALEVAVEFAKHIITPSDAISTGLNTVDLAIGKLQRRHLSVLASRTSVGKTALAWQIARNTARMKYKTLYVSTEMSAQDLWARVVSGVSGVEWRTFIDGTITQGQITTMVAQSNKLAQEYGDLLLIDENSYTPDEIHRSVAQVNPDIVFVDHMDELRKPAEYSKVEWLGEVMSHLRFIAKKYNCHIMAVHQINRGAEERQDKRPMLSDLRYSGDIEQKADSVFMLHRPDLYTDTPKGTVSVTEFLVKKNRMGAREIKIDLNFDLPTQHFSCKNKV